MSILHADNFTIYGTDPGRMLEGVYAEVGPVAFENDPDGISTDKVLACMTGGNNTGITDIRYVYQNGGVSSIGTAFRMWMNTLPVDFIATPILAVIRDIGNSTMLYVRVLPTGQIGFFNPNDELVVASDIPVLTAKGWYHIEVRYDITPGAPNATIAAEVRIEGRTVLEVAAVPTFSLTTSQMAFRNSNNFGGPTVKYWLKDLVIWDTLGTENNDFLGSVLVADLSPQADISGGWSFFGGATGAGILDNVPPLNNQYIFAEDDPLPAPYVCSLTDLPDEVTSVRAIVSYVRAAKSDGGDGGLQVAVISSPDDGPATALGQDRPITVAQTYWRDVFEIDPKTGQRWIPSAVNDAHLQINRTL